MKRLVLLLGALLSCAMAYGRPPFLEATRELRVDGLSLVEADVDGDWILARGLYNTNFGADPSWDYDIWEKIVMFHRSAAGEWQLVQTLADEYLIFNSDEHFADPHDLVLENGIAAFSTNSGLHIYELASGAWVSRAIVGAPQFPPWDLEFDGITLLTSDNSCSTAATAFRRLSDGRWAARGELIGQSACDEFFQRRLAIDGSRALVFEDGPFTTNPNDQVREFQYSGGAWQPGMTLPPPPGVNTTPYLFGPAIALRGDVALVAANGTDVYRRGASGFAYVGKIPLLVSALERPFAWDLEIGSRLTFLTYPGPSTLHDIAVVQPNSSGGYDHLATLGSAYDQNSLNSCGRRLVTTGGGVVHVYDLPQSLTPTPATLHDFENGTSGWTPLSGRFAVATRGATRVYRQSSLTADAVALNSRDLRATLITADVRPTAFDGTGRWVGLVARYIDENNMYYVTMRNNGVTSIRRKLNGVITELATYYPAVQVGTNYRVSFEVIGNRLAFYNGEYSISVYDWEHALPHGRAGVRTYRATADFDNVIITPMPLMELGGGPSFSSISRFDVVDGNWATGGTSGISQSSTVGNARALHGPRTDDQVVSMSARITDIGSQATGSHWVGAMVRYRNPSNYYYVSLRTTNELSLRKVVDGVVTQIARVPFTVNLNQPYRLRVEAIGSRLIVYVDDEVRLQASDTSHTQGRSGVVTYRAAASFADYTVLQP